MTAFHLFRLDDLCTATLGGRFVPARVILASKSGISLGIQFEGILGGYLDIIPVLWSEEQHEFVTLHGDVVGLVPAEGKAHGL